MGTLEAKLLGSNAKMDGSRLRPTEVPLHARTAVRMVPPMELGQVRLIRSGVNMTDNAICQGKTSMAQASVITMTGTFVWLNPSMASSKCSRHCYHTCLCHRRLALANCIVRHIHTTPYQSHLPQLHRRHHSYRSSSMQGNLRRS